MGSNIRCKFGFHSWLRQSDRWVKPEENGYQIRYICKRCYSATKTVEVTDAEGREGRCVSTNIEEWTYEKRR